MTERKRTTKELAKRIQWDYYKKSFPIPSWRRTLSIGLTALGLLWLGWDALSSKQAYNAGPLAQAHKVVTNQCESCHALPSSWGKTTGDQPCLACHDAPRHQSRQTFTPACASCHVEHQGVFRLANTTDSSCTQCHASLRVNEGRIDVAASINSLSSGHPEFAAIRDGHAPDPGTLKLNHQIHLKPDLKGPNGNVQLACQDCHQSAERSATMAPVTFEQHCKTCHPLVYDKRFSDAVPHKETLAVAAYVSQRYTEYIRQHPAEVHEPVKLNPDLPDRPVPPAPRNAKEWIGQRLEEAGRLLWQKTCKECHLLTYPAPSTRPEVPKAQAAARWMKNARFNHQPHQLVACTECHTQASTSQKTEDVLLPGIATCQKCHYEGAKAAESRCFECHVYHDWSKAKGVRSKGIISQFGR